MIWNWNTEEEGDYPKSIITINKIPLNNTRTFKYLGVWNTANDIHIGKTELDYRLTLQSALLLNTVECSQIRTSH